MRFLFVLIALVGIVGSAFTQPCLSDYYYDSYQKAHPELLQEFNRFKYLTDKAPQQKTNGTVRIIPVVFHVIHQYGPENISKAQIDSAIKFLNEDFRKQNPDTSKTRNIFKPFASDCEIEFRLARKDPNGNCTDGIVRINSPLTIEADDNVKDLSWWDNTMYLNIWVVKSISMNGFGLSGTILGYAQFPNGGSPATDGVVIRNDCVGRIGTELTSGFNKYGRTLTHEVGHWLGLFHTFQSGCNGGDQVSDTPPVDSANFGCSLSTNTCTNFTAPYTTDPPDMLENYMDYTSGPCQNLFTAGQKARMDGVLTNYRNNLYSTANLNATGVNQSGPSVCVPKADFLAVKTLACAGVDFSFLDYSYNGNITQWDWTFTGASTVKSSAQNPEHISWSLPGSYDVTLKVTTPYGSNTITRNNYITITSKQANDTIPVLQSFENGDIANEGWVLDNRGNTTTWVRSIAAKHTGTTSYMINHYSGTLNGDIDAFYSKGYNLTNVKLPFISFYTAYAQRDASINDALKMYISTDCGETWQAKLSFAGNSLAGKVPVHPGFYVPQSGDWVQRLYDLNAYAGLPSVRFRFETLSREGNAIYIDDISIGDAFVGMNALGTHQGFKINMNPNPFLVQTNLLLGFDHPTHATIKVVDVMGKEIEIAKEREFPEGTSVLLMSESIFGGLSGDIYFVLITIDGINYTRRLVKL